MRRLLLTAVAGLCFVATFSAQAPYRILVADDDGVEAPGIEALADALKPLGEVTIVAPRTNQSGKGHSLTLGEAIVRTDLTLPNGMKAIGLSATPATTVKIALALLVKPRPDLVVTGVNRGYNLAMATYISGTVGGAREAALQGIPAIASSLAHPASTDVASYRPAAEMTARVAALVKRQGLPKGVFLNVSVPAGTVATFRGLKLTTQGLNPGGTETFTEAQEGGKTVYRGNFIEGGPDAVGSDTWAVQQGWVAVTPLHVGEFDARAMKALRKLIK